MLLQQRIGPQTLVKAYFTKSIINYNTTSAEQISEIA